MTPHYSKIHNRFKLDGRYFDHTALKEVAYSYVKEGLPFEITIGDFLLDWLNDKPYVIVKTSGSTGKPKSIRLEKQAMVHSAIATGDFFKLQSGDSALLCLPADFIAGKMMLVRAMILGLELDTSAPKSIPLFNHNKHYNFSAMTPMQLKGSLEHIKNIDKLIVGGGMVSSELKEKAKSCSTQLFETYGMTETITHVAVKKLNRQNDVTLSCVEKSLFKTLPNIEITQDNRDCLEIRAPYISAEKIVTNDIVKLHSETTFEWLGRYDNVINSGGVKLFPEQLEQKLEAKIKDNFFITSMPDETLGERLVLVLESTSNHLEATIFEGLAKYQIPKEVLCTSTFIYTKSGKIERSKTLNSIFSHA